MYLYSAALVRFEIVFIEITVCCIHTLSSNATASANVKVKRNVEYLAVIMHGVLLL